MSETTQLIPLAHLRESPFNPRKRFNEAALAEMAETMKPPLGRLHQPIVVRPLVQADVEHTHEVVFGHRRFRAAGLAGLSDIEAFVRDMTDAEVKRAQIVENLHREDVDAIEEADGMHALRREHAATIETLMKEAGKSRSYVYNRLRLATAHDKLRDAVQSGQVDAEVAQEIARVPNPLQPKALEDSLQTEWRDGKQVRVAKSYRAVKAMLAERYQLSLADAPFDMLSIKLVPGRPACDYCPERSDAEPVLLEALGQDVCTNPDCFGQKKAAAMQLQIDAAKRAKRPVIEGAAAEEILAGSWDAAPDGYVKLSELALRAFENNGENVTYRQALEKLGKKAPAITLIVHPHRANTTFDCLTEAQALEVWAALKSSTQMPAGDEGTNAAQGGVLMDHHQRLEAVDDDDDEADWWADWSPEQRVFLDLDTSLEVRRAVLSKAIAAPRSVDDLRLLLHREIDLADGFGVEGEAVGLDVAMRAAREAADDDFNERDWLTAWVDTASDDQVTALVIALAVGWMLEGRLYGVTGREKAAKRVELARHYGVDVLDPTGERAAAETASTPPPAARAPKKAKAAKPAAVPAAAAPAEEQGTLDLAGDEYHAAAAAAAPVKKAKKQKDKPASPTQEQSDNAGSAGESTATVELAAKAEEAEA